jgi:hypothetical protein
MFFNSLGHRRVVTNLIERLFSFVDSPRERPWVAMGAFGIFILIGAGWVNQAQVLPGVSITETDLPGAVVDIVWSEDGEHALALVDDGDNIILMLRGDTGSWNTIDCNCNATAIGGSENLWLVGGEDGWFGFMFAGENTIAARSLNWQDTAPDIVSLDGQLASGWLIAEMATSRSVYSWSGLNVSEGASYPINDISLDQIESVAGGALIIGHDQTSNPAQGLSSEVLIEAERNTSGAPILTMLHRGAGAPLHTIIPVDNHFEGCTQNCLIAIVGGGDSIYGITSDSTVGRNMHRVAGSIGIETIAMDSQNMIWYQSENGLYNLQIGDPNPTLMKLPEGTPGDLYAASIAGDNVVMFSEDGETRVTIDPMAQHSLLRSLSLLGDLILVMTFLAFFGFGGHALLRKHAVL